MPAPLEPFGPDGLVPDSKSPSLQDKDEQWQLDKLKEWAEMADNNGWSVKGSLCADGRITVDMA